MGVRPSTTERIHSLEGELFRYLGARVVRIVDGPDHRTSDHAHDWPILSVHLAGSCLKHDDLGAHEIDGPAVVLHPPRAYHANETGPRGLEQIDIEFDPDWVPIGPITDHVSIWQGGETAACARLLASALSRGALDETTARTALCSLLYSARMITPAPAPAWMTHAVRRTEAGMSTEALAFEIGMHPRWLAARYRRFVGEGIARTRLRRRVEDASMLLLGTDVPAADIALQTGFCDQSHMVRAFRTILGRTPQQVRRNLH